MRVKNVAKIAVFYSFAGTGKLGKTLKPGALSPRLPAQRYYDPALQRALGRGLIEVQFDDMDVGVVGVAGIPGPVAKVLNTLQGEKKVPEVIVVSTPVQLQTESQGQPKRKPARAEKILKDSVRASALAKELKVPFHTLAAALEKLAGKRFYPLSPVSPDQVAAMRDKYEEKLEVPPIADAPSLDRGEVRTLADLSGGSDGIISLADLANENRMRGAGS